MVLNGVASGWSEVLSGVPQGSVLGPLLFIIYVNDMDRNLLNKLLKFADDAKLYGRVNGEDGIRGLREDLGRLVEWSEEWGMIFNEVKCKVMHFGANNIEANYQINGHVLDVVEEERDLGVIVSNTLKVSAQCVKAVKTVNKILGLIKRTFTTRQKDIIINLYKSLVRPHLEYCMSAWRPHYVKDIELLEGVQRRATKLIEEFKGLEYEERLKRVGLTKLETRRLRGDLIEVFKIFHGLTDQNPLEFFTLASNNLRGHALKLYKPRILGDIGKFSFSFRVLNHWNDLPEEVVFTDNVNSFKNKIDVIIRDTWGLI